MVYWCTELISLEDDGPRVNHEPRVRLFKRSPKYIFDEVSFYDFNEFVAPSSFYWETHEQYEAEQE